MTKPYLVALEDADGLPIRQRIEAEVRFAQEIERALGGEEAVAEAYKAWVDVGEARASQIDASTAAKAVRWPRAMNAATTAGFRELGDVGQAHFEVRLDRQVRSSPRA